MKDRTMHLLVTNIAWDTEGQTLEECCLPETVVVLDAPDIMYGAITDPLGELLLNSFGFGFDPSKLTWEVLGSCHDTHAGGAFFPKNLAIVKWRTYT